MRIRGVWLQLAALGLVVGILGVTQFRTQTNIAKAIQAQSPVNQAQVISSLLESNAALNQEIRTQEEQLKKYQEVWGGSGLEALVADMNRFKVINGLVEVGGPGVEVWVRGPIKVEELQDIINELRNAGAEALALSSQRLVLNSVVTRQEGRLLLDGVAAGPPYVLQAIGDGQTMESALERKGGVIPLLRYSYPSLDVTVTRIRHVILPAYQGRYAFRFARPVE